MGSRTDVRRADGDLHGSLGRRRAQLAGRPHAREAGALLQQHDDGQLVRRRSRSRRPFDVVGRSIVAEGVDRLQADGVRDPDLREEETFDAAASKR